MQDCKCISLLAALVLMPVPGTAAARSSVGTTVRCCESPTEWRPRIVDGEALAHIVTTDGKVAMVLTRDVLAFQLSDRAMKKVDRELREARREREDHPIESAIKASVLAGVRSLLDHAATCPVDEIRDIQWRGDRLVITSRRGKRLFGGLEVDDRDVLESFREQEARLVIEEFRRLQRR